MHLSQFTLVDQAITNLLIGFGLALLNVIFCYFVKGAPRIIKIIPRTPLLRWLLFAYLIALILQLVTSPIFRALTVSVYTEMAWSPFQALFNVLGVVLMDVIALVYLGLQRGAEAGREGLTAVSKRAAETLERIDLPFDGKQPEKPQPPEAQRPGLDDRLKDY